VIVQAQRLIGGARKIVKITEIVGMEKDTVSMQDIFEFVQLGVDEQRRAKGYFNATGLRPECMKKLHAAGEDLPIELFERRKLSSE
jgi:pilus assembly protein CpaF